MRDCSQGLLFQLPSPCSSHYFQLSSCSFLLTPSHLTQMHAATDTSQKLGNVWRKFNPARLGIRGLPNSTAQTALQRKIATLNWRYTFCTGLVRDDAQLLCSLLVRKHIHSSPKVRTGRLVTRSTRKCRVSPGNTDVASSEMGSNTGCQCGPMPRDICSPEEQGWWARA